VSRAGGRLDVLHQSGDYGSTKEPLMDGAHAPEAGPTHKSGELLIEIYDAIRMGAEAFLFAEYRICAVFIVVFGLVVLILVSHVGKQPNTSSKWNFKDGGLTTIAFVVGGATSIICGYIGMMVAVFSNARTTVSAIPNGAPGWKGSFNAAFRAGAVTGFILCGVSLLVLYVLAGLFSLHYKSNEHASALFEALSGYGLGGSSIAMFGRVGGGIYTKAADVGADLAGKVVENIPEDDPRNPATIADNVGDNVGDVAGMGSDLFGSFAEATCAALLVGSTSLEILGHGWGAICFPMIISAGGILVCLITHFIATDVWPVGSEEGVQRALKVQIAVSTILMTAILFPLIQAYLPEKFEFYEGASGTTYHGTRAKAFFCVAVGLWGGCVIGFVTEYFTSHSYTPTREVARSTETGAATNIIYGLALGYKSAIIPVSVLSICILVSFKLCGMYGVALSALGMLSTLATCLSIDVYGPICDNAGGIAEMSGLPKSVREKTDALDAAGNTTAAIGKGFAIGSACLVSLALFGAFVTRVNSNPESPLATGVSLLHPITFASLVFGAMIPYWFSAMTMKSVGLAAMEMVKEVARQFRDIPGLLEGTPGHGAPDHAACIKISTDASLREMILPGALVMLSPILFGIFFGVRAVCGLLSGSLVSSVQVRVCHCWAGAPAGARISLCLLVGSTACDLNVQYGWRVGQRQEVRGGRPPEVHGERRGGCAAQGQVRRDAAWLGVLPWCCRDPRVLLRVGAALHTRPPLSATRLAIP
jgi:inorganic pyrophosphatase